MQLLKHQKKASKKIRKKLKKEGVCLLWGEPRSGKTLSFIDAADKLYKRILIITTKKAMADIHSAVGSYRPNNHFDIINYHSCQKFHVNDYDCIILDEAHNYIPGYPKRSSIWRNVFHYSKKCIPIIYSSGTPTPEGYAGLFNMFALSHKSPWRKYRRFTEWHRDYGRPYTIKIQDKNIKQYNRTIINKVKKDVEKFIVTITRKEAGHKFEAVDKLYHIKLPKVQQDIVKILDKDRLYIQKKNKKKKIKKMVILADTPAKLNQKKHQISGGIVKCEDERIIYFKDNPKVNFIKENFDPEKCIIVAYYKLEQEMLSKIFPNVGSITSNSEGVDYSHFEHMVIYSMAHAAKTYEQIRARQLNMIKRKSEVIINFLISGIDQKVYDAVSNKKNFTASWYRNNR